MVASQTIFGSVLSLFSLLEEFQWDWFKFFLVCLVEFTYETIRSWTSICREVFCFCFFNRFYLAVTAHKRGAVAMVHECSREELPHVQGQGQKLGGPHAQGVAAKRSYPMSEVRGGGQEEQPYVQGAVAAWA